MAEPSHQTNRAPGRKQAGRSLPITRHPLFPAIVALWFGTLLGLGSFVLRTSMLEALVVAAGIDSLVPAAAPPLGMTARLLLALVLGVIGGGIGWSIARPMTKQKDEPASKVFKVDDADLDAPVRRPEAPRSVAPVIEKPAAVLDPATLFQDVQPEAAMPAPLPAPVLIDAPVLIETPEAAEPAPVQAAEVVPPTAPAQTAAQRIASADLGDLSHVELMERLAIGLQQRQERLDAAPAAAAEPTPAVVQFPDFADRRNTRQPQPAAPSRPTALETERALRDALVQLQRISGSA